MEKLITTGLVGFVAIIIADAAGFIHVGLFDAAARLIATVCGG